MNTLLPPEHSSLSLPGLDLKQLRQLCQSWRQQLLTGACIYLSGELGSGKTTFCQLLLAELGLSAAVKSPTYTLLEPYAIDDLQVCHLDLYRLYDPEELLNLGLEAYLDAPQLLLLVEWAERGGGYLPAADLRLGLAMSPGAEDRRDLLLSAHSAIGERLLGLATRGG